MARPRTFDEQEVLNRAVALFKERGFERASIPELTARLGICRQSLYNEFGDKRGLYLAALDLYGTQQIDAKLAALKASPSALEDVRALISSWSTLGAQCPGDGCLTITAIVDSSDDPDALAIVEGHVERIEKGFRSALKRAQSAGELIEDAPITRMARSLVSTYYGLGVLSKLPGSSQRIKATVADALERLETFVSRA